ncbi:MAG: NTP transferase domain-containing protein [Bacteroidaceae bacterium]|nr:NTP transferase domain-containing protein [Bacteroidaceae bacterium]
MQELKELYISTFNKQPKTVEQLKGAGSNRQYYRFCDADGNSVIGAVGTSVEENEAFIYLSRHFTEKKLPVPEVYAVSNDKLRYLQQDLGSRSLFDAIADGREKGGNYSEEEIALLENTIRQLPRIQVLGAEGLDWNVCYPQPSFDKQNVFFDLNYFKYCFLKATGIDFNEVKLEADFQAFAEDLTQRPPLTPPQGEDGTIRMATPPLWGGREGPGSSTFMYRDFQARNIMLDGKGNPLFIDFQGGRRGPLCYDLASFLWQASARYPQSLREHLIDVYFEELQSLCQGQSQSREAFDKQLSSMVLFRLLQVLGAYGFRGYFERKQHFIDSIPPALENLKELLAKHEFPYAYMISVLNKLIEKLQPASETVETIETSETPPLWGGREGAAPLTVRIFSFSYKKGIPQDPSGNGGGYVFDCRSTHNPGRYEPYKKITGLDPRVIKFLEDDGEIVTFLQSVYKLADFHIERYLQRGFTSLMFSFGCTGGQHRSVYSAQHLADRIRKKYPQVKVELCHREQERPHALIFAAGLGTRLKPLTDTMPKALVRVGEKTLLERTIDTLKAVGIDHMTVNVHHFSDQIKAFLADYLSPCGGVGGGQGWGGSIRISDETDKLLDTGGGLLKAREQFNGVAPILIHNVDIISNANLERLMAESKSNDAVATLLVSRRETSRYLIFDRDNNLVGWKNIKTGEVKGSEPAGSQMFAFSGIHIVKQSIFPLLEEYAQSPPLTPPQGEDETIRTANTPLVGEMEAVFGITDFYLWACQRAKIQCLVQDDLQLTDVGKLDTLAQLNS